MTTATLTPGRLSSDAHRLTFGGQVSSAWISLTTLRGTAASLITGSVIAVIGGIALPLVFQMLIGGGVMTPETVPPLITVALATNLVIQLIALIIGVGAYSKDDSSGALRTLTAAAPSRVSGLLARALVVAVTTFVWGVANFLLSAGVGFAMYQVLGYSETTTDVAGAFVLPLVGSAIVVALCALLGIGLAVIVRSENWAAIIGVTLLVLVPLVLGSIPIEIIQNINQVMFGTTMNAFQQTPISFEADAIIDMVITVAWPAAVLAVAATLLSKRDV